MSLNKYLISFLIILMSQHVLAFQGDHISQESFGFKFSIEMNSSIRSKLSFQYVDTLGKELLIPIRDNKQYSSGLSCTATTSECNKFYLSTLTLLLGVSYLAHELGAFDDYKPFP